MGSTTACIEGEVSSSPSPSLSQNEKSTQFPRGFALPCSWQSVCTLWEQSAHARKLHPVWMTAVMRKQYVYNQHQSMACALWLALTHHRVSKQLRNLVWPPGLDNPLDYCPCFLLPVRSLNLSIWSAGNILCLQANFFSGTLLAGGVEAGSGLSRTKIFSQVPQMYLFFPQTHILSLSWVALSLSCLPPWLSSIPFHRPGVPQYPQIPGQAQVMPASAPVADTWDTEVPLALR